MGTTSKDRYVFVGQMGSVFGPLFLAATDRGLAAVQFGLPLERLVHRLKRRGLRPIEDTGTKVQPFVEALACYLDGEKTLDDCPLDLDGCTVFQKGVWEVVRQIPFGEVLTYQEVAEEVGCAGGARAVGAANGANPVPPFVPCHRVIGKDGGLRGYAYGLEVKRSLLDLEHASLSPGLSSCFFQPTHVCATR